MPALWIAARLRNIVTMQVVVRCLLMATMLMGVACSLNQHGLSGMDGGRPGAGAGGTNPQGAAGGGGTSVSATGTGGTMPATSGAAGTDTAPGGGSAGGGAPDPTGAGGGAGDGSINGTAGTAVDAGTGGGGAGGMNGGNAGGANGGAAGGSNVAGTGGNTTVGAAGTNAGGVNGEPGCSDGTREGYLDMVKYPRIAACSGGWERPGLSSSDSHSPQCSRRAGNDGDRPEGRSCSVADLCASGWTVCENAHAVSIISGGCQDALAPFGRDQPVYFLTRQRGTFVMCETFTQTGTNNLYGCGNIGSPADRSCAPFTFMLRDTDCRDQPPWGCTDGPLGTSQDEYDVVTKAGPSRGGVLCCKN